jgi:site-specific recombinase XerD
MGILMPPVTRNSTALPVKPGNPLAIRSLPLQEWPEADRSAWEVACKPAERLKRGGAASHMKEITRRDLGRRYGYFLDHVERTGGLEANASAAVLVTPQRVERFLAELQGRLSSVTVHGTIYKLCRMAQLLAPERDYQWLTEIENDLALVMVPKSKTHRLVYPNVTAEAGMTLMVEADAAVHRSALARARQFRNGLMIALMAFHSIRLKNFAALEIGCSFVKTNDKWWIVLRASETKEKRPDERVVDDSLISWLERYLTVHRPILARGNTGQTALWLSSNDGKPMTYTAVERVFSLTTKETPGVDLSPHLFRMASASSCAVWAGNQPYLASALLHHRDPCVANEHYNRSASSSATQQFGALIRRIQVKNPARRKGL